MRDETIWKIRQFSPKIIALLVCLLFFAVITATSTVQAAHVVINEVELNPPEDDRRSTTMEWVELYNPTSNDVNLGGWTLSTTGGKGTHTFTIYGSIKANGYYVYDHSRWLDNEDESIILGDASGNEMDKTSLLKDKKNDDRSWQRYPNGIDTDSYSDWKFRSSTKGYSNSPEPTPSPTPTPIPTPSPLPTYHKWIEKADTPKTGGYGEAVVGASDYIYIARCMYASSAPYFWRYDPTMDGWDSMNTSGLPTGAFRNGVALTWDNESHIYALLGGRYSDTNRRLFYRYSISNNSWEQLIDTPHAQGAGDAIAWSGYDSNLYGIMGSKGHGTDFAYYNISTNSWNALPFNPNWTTTDDGASLTWTGGEYLYALRGEWQETIPDQDFARYHIPTKTWEGMYPIPESEGVGDGASLLWVDEYPGYIFALGGGSCLEDPGYNFYRYSISSDSWEQLEHIPCPIGYYVGNRLGFANSHIYYWQGAPSTWDCGGDAFYMFEFPSPLLPEDTNEIPTTPLIYKISPCDAVEISLENVTVTDFLNATNMTTVQAYNFKGYKGENTWMVKWSSSNRLLDVYVNVATGNITGIEEQTYPGSSPTPLPMPTYTPTAPLFEKIEGLTAIRVGGGSWDNWDADLENDGPVIYIVYLDARGDRITDDSTEKMPISADVKLYASDSVLGPCDKLVFSAHYTEDEIILGSIYPDIRIPKEEISVNPSTDYWCGAVEVTIYTPAQGSFADRGNYIRLYEE